MSELIPPRNAIHIYEPYPDGYLIGQRLMDRKGNLGTITATTHWGATVVCDSGETGELNQRDFEKYYEPVFTCNTCKQERPWSEGCDNEDPHEAGMCDTCWCAHQRNSENPGEE